MRKRYAWAIAAALSMSALSLVPVRRIMQMAARLGKTQKLTPSGNAVPRLVHRTVSAAELKPGRLVIVGDVHGCVIELRALLSKVAFKEGEDNLVFAGDLVNKGPASVEVLDEVLRLGALSVRGNHDDASLHRWRTWAAGDGKELKPQHAWVQRLQPHHVEAMEALPFTIRIPDYGVTIVHAGLAPDLGMEEQDLWAMYKMRNLAPASDAVAAAAVPEGKTRAVSKKWFAVEKDKHGGKAWAQVWNGPYHAFFGHDAKRRLQLCPLATGLDTSCVYGFQLTCAVMPPLSLLLAGGGTLGAKLAAGLPVTREDLGVEIVSVQAARAYLEPSAAAAAGPDAKGVLEAVVLEAAATAAASGGEGGLTG